MSVEDAINLLDQICSQVSLNRDTHAKVMEAVKVLRDKQKKKEE